MSIRIMSLVWSDGPDDKAELLVMLALADFADDAGRCWPSMLSIGKKARMTDRNARRIVRKLEADGYLKSIEGGGRHGCNQYQINSDKMSVGQNVRPGQNEHETRTKRARNPDIAMSAEPLRTIIEPLIGGRGLREAEKPTFREQILSACRVDPVSGLSGPNGRRIGTQADMYEAARWTDDLGLTEAECLAEIVAVVAAKRDGPPTSFRYFEKAMARLSAAKHAPPLQPDPTFQPRGPKPNERAAFDRAINQIADGLSAGTIHIDNSNRDPFAVRRG